MLLRRHNLNLLPILRELLRTKSVSQTATNLGISQSAVSSTLARLRETFEDELLIMDGRNFALTERGLQLVERTESACTEIETLFRAPAFDPRLETRRFVLATADYVAFLLAPAVAELLNEEAPEASVHFIDVPADALPELTRGTIDAIVIPDDTAAGLRAATSSMPLFLDEMVVIASRSAPPFDGPLTKEIYSGSRHAMFQMSPKHHTTHELLFLRRHGVLQHNLVVVQQFLALPSIVEGSDCLALIQRRLAERLARTHAIEAFEPPFELAPLALTAFWGKSVERDPAHTWFRGLLDRAAASLDA